MATQIKICFMIILLTILVSRAQDTKNAQPHSSKMRGRVVKLYSGSRPDPIQCKNEGFQADLQDCAVFYRCMKSGNGRYSVFRFQCGPGTIYDPENEVCNHPQNTKRSDCGRPLKPVVESNFNDIDEESHELPSPIITFEPVYTERPSTLKPTTPHLLTTPNSFLEISNSVNRENLSSATYTEDKATSTIALSTSKPQTISNSLTTLNAIKDPYQHSFGSSWETTTKRIWNRPSITSQTQPPNSQRDICTSDGFIGDSTNCHKFYRCVRNQKGGFVRYEFSCSEPTVWDDDLQSCNHPWAVKRSRCGRSDTNIINKLNLNNDNETKTTEKTVLGLQGLDSKIFQNQDRTSAVNNIHENKTQSSNDFYTTHFETSTTYQTRKLVIEHTTISEKQFPINYYGDKKTQIELQIDNSEKNDRLNEFSKKSTISPQHVEAKEKSTTIKLITDSTNICKESGFIGDKKDCKKFYRCVDNSKGSYTRYEYHCGEGTVWDPKIEGCNHAWAVKDCKFTSAIESTSQETNKINTSISSSTIKSMSIFQTTTSTNPNLDANTEKEDHGYEIIQVQKTTTESLPTAITPTITIEISQLNGVECVNSGFIGDKNNCTVFYRCVDTGDGKFTKFEFKCGDGTVWDPEIEACNHAWAVKECGSAATTEFVKINSTNKITNSPITSTATYPSFISASTMTVKEVDHIDDYDSEYDVSSKMPVYSSTGKTTKEPIKQIDALNNCKVTGFMRDQNDCRKFYRCVDNGNGSYKRYDFTCGHGTIWDPKIEACNHEWAVEKCMNNILTDDYMTTTSAKPNKNDEQINISYPIKDDLLIPETETIKSTVTENIYVSTSNLNLGHKCVKSGFMGDQIDCRKFYRCVDDGQGRYIQYEFSCGEGTVWDQTIESCNHAWAVKNCTTLHTSTPYAVENSTQTVIVNITNETEFEKSTEKILTSTQDYPVNGTHESCIKEGFKGDKKDCKKFYRCVHNGQGGFTKYEFTCGEGTFWNQNIQTCDHITPDKLCVISENNTIYGPQVENDEPYPETTNKISTHSNIDIVDASASEVIQITQTLCQEEGFYGHPYDCKKFYRCVNEGKIELIKYEFVCGDGTFWNDKIQACDHEYNSEKCSIDLSSSTHKTTNILSTLTDISSQEEKTTPKVETSIQSNFECISDGFFSNPNDCQKFIRCVNNNKGGYIQYHFTCGEGTIWVQDKQACDHFERSENCKNKNNSTEIVETNKPSSKQPQYSSPSIMSTETEVLAQQDIDANTEKNDFVSLTNETCLAEGYYGSEKNCRKYYRCVRDGHNGFIKYEFTCTEGTAWDGKIKSCNHLAEVVTCHSMTQVQNEAPPIYHDEDNDQKITSSSTGTTDISQLSGSTESTLVTDKDNCESEGFFGDTSDCNLFYRCVDDGKGGFIKYEYTCGDGTIWDQDLTTCNHQNNVVKPSCKQDNSSNGSSTSNNTGSANSTTGNNITCTNAGFYADPYDCKKFYRCVDWDGDGTRFSVYHFTCGEGTIWDPVVETCNHEESVYPPRDCSGNQSQIDTVNETTENTDITEKTTTESTTIDQKPSNTDKTTSTTAMQTTTQQTTTQQSTTTTQKSSTSEQTTPQTTTKQNTAPESTTTQKSTHQTTQQSTANEPTTTQRVTTSEQTTLQSTTNEQTTEQITTTQQTTHEVTTTEETTSQYSTTNGQTTTHEPSTVEQTTQQFTTGEQPTTQQSLTTEQTTVHSTTQSNIVTESTTEYQSTNEQTTTTETTYESPYTTELSLESTTEDMHSATEETSPDKPHCPETEEEQYLLVCPTSFKRHPKYCNMFYQCIEDDDTREPKIATFTCPNNTIYDETKVQCVENNKAEKKCQGTMATYRRVKRLGIVKKDPIIVGRQSQVCHTIGHYPFERDVQCSPAFLKCTKNKVGKILGHVYQCPPGYVYWNISRRCEQRENVRDCLFSTNDWINRWEIPSDSSNIAS